jgi:hypothetical protein
MWKVAPVAACSVLLGAGSASASYVDFGLTVHSAPLMLVPGASFSLDAMLLGSSEPVGDALMRLQASSNNVFSVTGGTYGTGWIPSRPVPSGPLNPNSAMFGGSVNELFPQQPPDLLITLDVLVAPTAQPGVYALRLDQIVANNASGIEFTDVQGDAINLQIVPEPATLILLLLGLATRRPVVR